MPDQVKIIPDDSTVTLCTGRVVRMVSLSQYVTYRKLQGEKVLPGIPDDYLNLIIISTLKLKVAKALGWPEDQIYLISPKCRKLLVHGEVKGKEKHQASQKKQMSAIHKVSPKPRMVKNLKGDLKEIHELMDRLDKERKDKENTKYQQIWIPKITCAARFDSYKDAGGLASSLVVMWLQDHWAMPISDSIFNDIQKIDWERESFDMAS